VKTHYDFLKDYMDAKARRMNGEEVKQNSQFWEENR
jgi:hypothetical protein